MRPVTFAQLADLHLGVRLSGSRLGLDAAKIEVRRREMCGVLVRVVEAARERKVDLVLLPGDLSDSAEVGDDTANFLIETLNRLAPIPVFIAPGNHDYFSSSSFYNPESAFCRSRGPSAPDWGGHIRIFPPDAFEVFRCGEDGRIAVAGTAFAEHGACPLESVPAPGDGINILLLHASLCDAAFIQTSEKQVMPVTAAALAGLGYDYIALGHYHGMGLVSGNGRLVGAYSGCPAATGLDETGEKGFILGTLPGDRPVGEDDLEFVRGDLRQVRKAALDVSSLTNQMAFEEELARAIEVGGAGKEDFVHIRLHGVHPRGIPFSVPDAVRERHFHVAVEDESLPDYDVSFDEPIPETPAETVEEHFRRSLIRRYRNATDDAERALVLDALCYGLDALTRREVNLR